MIILPVQTRVSIVGKDISFFQDLMQNMSIALTITCSNSHFTCSKVSFYCWKRHCSCSRSDEKHVHDTTNYLFKWPLYLFKCGLHSQVNNLLAFENPCEWNESHFECSNILVYATCFEAKRKKDKAPHSFRDLRQKNKKKKLESK